MKAILNMLASGSLGLAAFAALLFVPAGTFGYERAWILLAIFAAFAWLSSLYFLRRNPQMLQRRKVAAETRGQQKALVTGIFLLWASMFVVSALDHRFGWAAVPAAVSGVGYVLVLVGLSGAFLVMVQNSHASVTVQVETGQRLVSTGLYGLVRHPMYACNVFLLVGTPLALGSYWGLIFVVPELLLFALRILDEEKLLQRELRDYTDYMQRVRYRLAPGVW
ncbi:isoprenylcysteine carboxylmethyltransferase family protein [Mycobacterium sp. 1274756.6]|uniref:methyltransferase family protein n=1 Tax=Mycobacterium sp. 1274756.6 TaxID=1834076 RepID=UPI000800C6E6|nr:isoprenylcysteine carboxylmethyltransferase family protein [Mycobacterium sp. 1274756.6]OBJ70862.1 hypothetical protein A5643_09130 [Mycobacterium sp. 1274756.6]